MERDTELRGHRHCETQGGEQRARQSGSNPAGVARHPACGLILFMTEVKADRQKIK